MKTMNWLEALCLNMVLAFVLISVFESTAVANERTLELQVQPFSTKKAVLTSVLSTVGGMGLGMASIGLGLASGEEEFGLAVGVPLFVFGGTVGPSMGHFYTKNWLQGWVGTGIRTLSAGAAMLSALAFVEEAMSNSDGDCYDQNDQVVSCGGSAFWGSFLLVSWILNVGIYATSMIYDFATLGRSARRANERVGKLEPKFSVAPMVTASKATGRNSYGLSFSASF